MKAKTLLKFYDQRTINDQLKIILPEQYCGTLTYKAGSPQEKKVNAQNSKCTGCSGWADTRENLSRTSWVQFLYQFPR